MRVLALAGLALIALAAVPAGAQEEVPPPKQSWSFDGPFGTYDRAAAQRGFQVYEEVCSHCHSMNLLHYRDLAGIGYSEDEIKAIAASKQVTDGPNDQGEMYQRPGRPSDAFVPPFPNEQAARAAHQRRAAARSLADHQGARRRRRLRLTPCCTGFRPPPPGVKMADNMQYDIYFPGHQIAMPPPLAGDDVQYAGGTKPTLPQEAHDVTTFLAWASEPTMEERKFTGAKVLIFLLVMTGVLYAAKRQIWAELH